MQTSLSAIKSRLFAIHFAVAYLLREEASDVSNSTYPFFYIVVYSKDNKS